MQGVGADQALEGRIGFASGVEHLADREEDGALVLGCEAVQGGGLTAQEDKVGLRFRGAVVQWLLVDQIVQRLGIVGLEFERSPVAARGLVEPSLGVERIGQIVQCAGIVRSEIQDPASTGRGLLDSVESAVGRTQVQPGVRVQGLQGERPLIVRDRLDEPASTERGVPRLEPDPGLGHRRFARFGAGSPLAADMPCSTGATCPNAHRISS